MKPMDAALLKQKLDQVYRNYNKPEFINPDPLLFLYRYPDPGEREIAALIAAMLAYGRVSQILKTLSQLFGVLGVSPVNYLIKSGQQKIIYDFKSFQYRFTKADHLTSLLLGIKTVISEYGSLYNCFVDGISPNDTNIIPALSLFIKKLASEGDVGILAADPDKGSACKRNHLFLRWMVRSDDVDPGGWEGISRSKLIIPLDTHMHRVGIMLGFTTRKQGDIRTALAITDGFKRIIPEDPVRYDFCLTRFGIRKDMDFEVLRSYLA